MRLPIKLLIVVVTYNRDLRTSVTCQTLLQQLPSELNNIVLIYDNSPIPMIFSGPRNWTFVSNPRNGGLISAYSNALAQAVAKGCDWILLLDQDTQLPPNFIQAVHKDVLRFHDVNEVVAVVPTIYVNAQQVSPLFPRLGWELPVRRRAVVEKNWMMVINSGACIRVAFLNSIGGFCNKFWLDYLDYWLFRAIYSASKSVYITDTILQHDLSVTNLNNGVSVSRYKNALRAERKFTNDYLTPIWRIALAPRLLARATKHLFVTRNKQFAGSMFLAAGAQLISLFRRSHTPDRK